MPKAKAKQKRGGSSSLVQVSTQELSQFIARLTETPIQVDSTTASAGPSSLSTFSSLEPSVSSTRRRSSKVAAEDEPRPPRKNKLQEEHRRLLSVEANLVRRRADQRGPAGYAYDCLDGLNFPCEVCHKNFKTSFSLTRHMMSHSGPGQRHPTDRRQSGGRKGRGL